MTKLILVSAILALYSTLVASTFNTTTCINCVASDCIYCGVNPLFNLPTNSSVCHCGGFTKGNCRWYTQVSDTYETNQQCVDQKPAGWVDIEAGLRQRARTITIAVTVSVLVGVAACMTGIAVYFFRKRKARQEEAMSSEFPQPSKFAVASRDTEAQSPN